MSENPGTPKVLLFTDKEKGTPLIFKALSSHFDKTLLFGLVRKSESALVSKFKVKNFPTVLMVKDKDKPAQKYEGSEFSYQAIFDFINIYSETFVFHDSADQEVKSAASKPWLSEKVPLLTSDSGNDICLKKEGYLCVILLNKNQDSVSKDNLEMLNSIGQSFASKISRGINFNFMWLSAADEPEFFSVFK